VRVKLLNKVKNYEVLFTNSGGSRYSHATGKKAPVSTSVLPGTCGHQRRCSVEERAGSAEAEGNHVFWRQEPTWLW